jgi:hypothetical protein
LAFRAPKGLIERTRDGVQPVGLMTRRIRSILCRGAATALFACAGPALADPEPAVTSLPQWVVRAQERLALEPDQQRELRTLVDANSERLQELRERGAELDSSDARRAQREAMAALQFEFRGELARILTPAQLAEWDTLVEELLGQIHLRNAPRYADSAH